MQMLMGFMHDLPNKNLTTLCIHFHQFNLILNLKQIVPDDLIKKYTLFRKSRQDDESTMNVNKFVMRVIYILLKTMCIIKIQST